MKKIIISILIFTISVNFVNAQRQRFDPNDENAANLNKLVIATSYINSLYVDEVKGSQLVEDAIKGILENLDPHSVYTNAEETRKMNEPLEANFDGIGIQFNMLNDTLYVIQVIPSGPSEKVGLLPGDKIVQVDDQIIAGVNMVNSDITKIIRGKKGTEVIIRIKRGSSTDLLDFKIIRDRIPIYSIDATYMADSKTGYIRLSRFAATSLEEFKQSLTTLQNKGMQNLILDLQDNGGGYLHIAYALADQFFDKGKLIVYSEGNKFERSDAISTEQGIFKKGKLVILLNEYSASSSEIVAGAIQDWDRGVLVGRRSFGKGLVQRSINLPDSSMIRLTIARYYTPSGRNIQRPYEVGNAKSYQHDFSVRFYNGEHLNADSIHFPDTLKYSTLISNRTVYGGGGIMPDIFVPFDSTRITDYHLSLVRLGILNKLSMTYLDTHREELNSAYLTSKIYKENFNVSDETLNELLVMAEDEKIAFVEEQYNKSKEWIRLQLKALIARDLFEMSDYFEIINERNDSYQKALQIINDDEQYNQILVGL